MKRETAESMFRDDRFRSKEKGISIDSTASNCTVSLQLAVF